MIKVLDKIVSDKIAAGEVVERPLSVVKELIENAIDSGADSIICEIKNGGKTYIRVTDNGCGIAAEDSEVAFLRHATSKISAVDDLNSLETLGFRGEALASIAAVSRVELLTKVKEETAGTSLVIHGGEAISKQSVGCPQGTTLIVNDLFYNTPARLKFLKSDGAESSAIIEFMSQIALAFGHIKFRLISNDNIVFSTNGKSDRLQTIASVYHNVDTKNLIPLYGNEDGCTVEGYISNPGMSKPTRNSQVFFVNGRVIDSKIIERGLNRGYKQRLFEGRFPVAFLFLTIPANTIDVNIHPNKRQIRFNDEEKIISLIENSTISALSTKDSLVKPSDRILNKDQHIKTEEKEAHKSTAFDKIDIKELLSTNQETFQTSVENQFSYSEPSRVSEDTVPYRDEAFDEKIKIGKPDKIPFNFLDLSYIGTIFNTYILATDSDSFYIFDQHACHERVNYEKFVNLYNNSEKNTQPIMFPFVVTTNFESNINDNWAQALGKMGYVIEEFGYNSFRITEIPTFMTLSESEDFVNDFIDNLKEDIIIDNTIVIDKLIMKSCKASIKANDRITMDEIHGLMQQLSACQNPFSCPHGRPTFFKMTKYEIEKTFKRV